MKTNLLFRQAIALVCLAVVLPSGLNAQEKSRSSPNRPAETSAAPASPRPTAEDEAYRRRYGIPGTAAPSATPAQEYTLEIVEGQLLVANLKGRVDVRKRWGPGEIASVPATLVNIIDVLRDIHPEANLAVAPELANVKIANLKLRATSLDEELEALRVASGDKFIWTRPGLMAGVDAATGLPLAAAPGQTLYSLVPNDSGRSAASKRTVEVFNLGPYLQRKGTARDGSIKEIEQIILATLRKIKGDDFGDDTPSYQFHSGANLLIVIGQPDALEVARKVLSALEGEASGLGGGGGLSGSGGGGGVGLNSFLSAGRNTETSKARQKIVDKLEGIQLDTVLFQSLGLGEVIQSLIDEAKKRDPEKKGINILIDPNGPPAAVTPVIDPTSGLPVTPPPVEPVDIRTVSITIDPALNNVRLVDVLDAMAKVADRPIKYSITDYAVVFSLGEQDRSADGAQLPGAPPDRFGNR